MQKNLKKEFIQAGKVIVIALVLGLGVGFVHADLSQPTDVAPYCGTGNPGCDIPINTSATTQSKSGALSLTDTTDASALNVTNGMNIGTQLHDQGSYYGQQYQWSTGTGMDVGLNEPSSFLGIFQGTSGTYAPSNAVSALGGISLVSANLNEFGNITADFSGDTNPASSADFYMPLNLAPKLNNVTGTPLSIDLSKNTGSSMSNAINITGGSQTNTVGIEQNVPNFFFYNYGSGGGVNLDASKVELQDGTQGAGNILVSDANGVSSWKVPPAPPVSQYEIITTEVNSTGGGSCINDTGNCSSNSGTQSNMHLESTSNINLFYCPSDHPIMLSAGGNCTTSAAVSTLYIDSPGSSGSPGYMTLDCTGGTDPGVHDLQEAQYVCSTQ